MRVMKRIEKTGKVCRKDDIWDEIYEPEEGDMAKVYVVQRGTIREREEERGEKKSKEKTNKQQNDGQNHNPTSAV